MSKISKISEEFYNLNVEQIVPTEFKNILTLDNVLSAEQCQMIIDNYNSSDPVHVSEDGYRKEYRDNYRVLYQDTVLADYIFNRVSEFISDKTMQIVENSFGVEESLLFSGTWELNNLNNMFRLCKYEDGGKFETHYDAFYRDSFDRRSFKTFMIYLNDNDAGTTFNDDDLEINFTVVPKAGSCLIFNHYIKHKGEEVKNSEKYIMRSDLMFNRIGEFCDSTNKYQACLEMDLGRICEENGDFDNAVKHYMKARSFDKNI